MFVFDENHKYDYDVTYTHKGETYTSVYGYGEGFKTLPFGLQKNVVDKLNEISEKEIFCFRSYNKLEIDENTKFTNLDTAIHCMLDHKRGGCIRVFDEKFPDGKTISYCSEKCFVFSVLDYLREYVPFLNIYFKAQPIKHGDNVQRTDCKDIFSISIAKNVLLNDLASDSILIYEDGRVDNIKLPVNVYRNIAYELYECLDFEGHHGRQYIETTKLSYDNPFNTPRVLEDNSYVKVDGELFNVIYSVVDNHISFIHVKL